MPPPSDLVEELLQRGNDLLKQEQYQDALTVLEQACQLAPFSARAYSLRGRALQSLKRYGEAVIAFEQANHFGASSAIDWYLMGLALTFLKHLADALAAFEQCLRCDLNHANAWYQKGIILTRLNRSEDASVAFAQARRIDPSVGFDDAADFLLPFADAMFELSEALGHSNPATTGVYVRQLTQECQCPHRAYGDALRGETVDGVTS